jgi:hypothetical protein
MILFVVLFQHRGLLSGDPGRSGPSTDRGAPREPGNLPPPSGHWEASVTTPDSVVHEVSVDLGIFGARWVGEFDLPSYGVEDYPVEVALSDTAVDLHFTAVSVDFHGRLAASGETIDGIARLEAPEIQEYHVVFQRTGDAAFSAQLLGLEAAADDSMTVRALRDGPADLRSRFNRDRDDVRLLMLLAPT